MYTSQAYQCALYGGNWANVHIWYNIADDIFDKDFQSDNIIIAINERDEWDWVKYKHDEVKSNNERSWDGN